jgi:HKD family nuclease
MKIEFLGQGYQSEWDRPVGNYLIQFLESGLFHTFTALSAFASVGGVLALGKSVQQARDSSVQINIIVGVDQKGTSKEALEALMALGVHTFVFTQREHPIFHPKLYLFEGENNSALIIGSSNLTLKGLWQNVEASILIEIEHQDEAGIVEEIKTYFSGLFDFTDPNLMPLNGAVIEQLVQLKKVPTEAERKRLHDEKKKIKVDAEEADSIREILENLIPGRAVNKLPQVFFDAVKSARSSPIGEELPAKQQVVAVPEDRGVLVWRRKKLPASSVQMAGTGTNPTGGLRLVQDHFEVNGQVTIGQHFPERHFGK